MVKKVQCLSCNGILVMSRVGSLTCKCGKIEAILDKAEKVSVSRYPTDPYRFLPDKESKKTTPRLQE